MSLFITHFQFTGSRWYMRFTGPRDEFEEMKNIFKRSVHPAAYWSLEHPRWPDGKQGAWLVHGMQLKEHQENFKNLGGTCDYSQDRTSHIYACEYWLEPGKIGYGKYTYSLPR